MFKAKNPQYKEVIEDKLTRQYFMKHIGFKITNIKEGLVEGELPIEQFHKQQNEALHGGLVSTVCDIVAGFAAFSLVPEGKHVVTAEIKISCLRAGRGERLYAKGWVVKPGNHLSFCESEAWVINGKEKVLIAKATTTMAVLDRF